MNIYKNVEMIWCCLCVYEEVASGGGQWEQAANISKKLIHSTYFSVFNETPTLLYILADIVL